MNASKTRLRKAEPTADTHHPYPLLVMPGRPSKARGRVRLALIALAPDRSVEERERLYC